MEIEVIKHISFDEQNERLFYTSLQDEKEEMARREFLKYLTIGSAGLLIPMGVPRNAEAIWWWIPAIVRAIAVFAASGVVTYAFERYDKKTVKTRLSNTNKRKAAEGNLKLNLARKDPDFKYVLINSKSIYEEIPPKHTAVVVANLSSADRKGRYKVRATSKHGSKSTKFKVI